MFSYVVTYFDSDERTNVTEKGILAAETYGKAADRLVDFYGKECLITMALSQVEDILTKDQLIFELNEMGEN